MAPGHAVCGLKGGKLRVITDQYDVHTCWDTIPTLSFSELFNHPKTQDDKVPRKRYSYYNKPYKMYHFNGWEHRHYVDPESDTQAI